jgi:hypothetical protein
VTRLTAGGVGEHSVTKLIALDCEMVGVGIEGKESMLARVCIINSFGNVIYDKFVKPRYAHAARMHDLCTHVCVRCRTEG